MEAEPEQKRSTPPSLIPACIADVLDNPDLLRDIIERIRDPPSLVRASLVSKKWYRICSDPNVLSVFVKQQPRRLLGYFALYDELEMRLRFFLFKEDPERAGGARFLSVSFPESISQATDRRSCVLEDVAELACISRFLSCTFPEGPCDALDCRSGRVLLNFGRSLVICDPLRQKVWLLPLLTFPFPTPRLGTFALQYSLLTEDGLSAVHVRAAYVGFGLVVYVGCLKGDKWVFDSDGIQFFEEDSRCYYESFCYPPVLVNGCIFMLTIFDRMVKVTLKDCEISLIDLPSFRCHWGEHQLCRGKGPDLFYVNTHRQNIQIWLYSQGAWTHYNTIDLPIIFANSNMPWSGCGDVCIYGVGDAAEFIFFGLHDPALYLLDVRSCIVEKVGEKTSEIYGEMIGNTIIPLVTSCHPVFPQIREDKIDIKMLEIEIAEGNKIHRDQLRAISLDEHSVKNFIKTCYPSTANLIWSIDDCLTLLHYVAVLPAVEGGRLHNRIYSCRRLIKKWKQYIIQTRSLRKRVVSVNDVYYQAEVSGQIVTWRCPLVSRQLFWLHFDVNLLIFYEHCLELLLDSLNNVPGAFWGERDILTPNFQYSETIKRLRCVLDNLKVLKR